MGWINEPMSQWMKIKILDLELVSLLWSCPRPIGPSDYARKLLKSKRHFWRNEPAIINPQKAIGDWRLQKKSCGEAGQWTMAKKKTRKTEKFKPNWEIEIETAAKIGLRAWTKIRKARSGDIRNVICELILSSIWLIGRRCHCGHLDYLGLASCQIQNGCKRQR